MSKTQNIISWIVRAIAAIILLQTLFFKFTAHPDSVYIFEQVGLGDAGRIGTGIVELVAALLLFLPRTAWLGALLTLGVISGAIISHLSLLGIEVQGDGGTLFAMALVVFVSALVALILHRRDIPVFGPQLA